MYEIAAIAPEAFKIADRLTLLMEEHEPPVTRSELADAIGCARSTISRYCDGTNSVAFIFAIRIARFFNVSLDYLVGLTDSKEIPQWQKPGKHKHSEHWHLKNICKRCYYRREMVGLAGISGFDIEYDNISWENPLDEEEMDYLTQITPTSFVLDPKGEPGRIDQLDSALITKFGAFLNKKNGEIEDDKYYCAPEFRRNEVCYYGCLLYTCPSPRDTR